MSESDTPLPATATTFGPGDTTKKDKMMDLSKGFSVKTSNFVLHGENKSNSSTSSKSKADKHPLLHISFNDDRFGIKCSSEPSTPMSRSSQDNPFGSYSKTHLPFSSLTKHVAPERRILIQDEVDKAIQKELETLKANNEISTSPVKGPPSMRRLITAERNNKAIQKVFDRENENYKKLEAQYWAALKTPYPPSYSEIETYHKKDRMIEMQMADIQCVLDEIFRRKVISDASKESTVSFTASRKIPKIFKSRR